MANSRLRLNLHSDLLSIDENIKKRFGFFDETIYKTVYQKQSARCLNSTSTKLVMKQTHEIRSLIKKQPSILEELIPAKEVSNALTPYVKSTDPAIQKKINLISEMTPLNITSSIREAKHAENRIIIWQALTRRVQQLAEELSALDAAEILSILGEKRLRDPETLTALLKRVTSSLSQLEDHNLVQVIWGLSRLRVRSDSTFKAAAREIAGRAAMMTGKQIGLSMMSFAILKYYHPQLHDVLRLDVMNKIRTLKPRELTMMIQSLSLLNLKQDQRLFASLVGQINRIITEFTGPQLACVLATYAKFKVEHPLVLESMSKELFSKLNDLYPMNVACVINACAHLSIMKSDLIIKSLVDKLMVEGQYYSLEQICLITSGLSTLQERMPGIRSQMKALFETFGRRIGESSLQLKPQQIASLVYSYGKAKVRYGPLFLHAVLHVERFHENYSADCLAMILQTYSKLDLRHPFLIDLVLAKLNKFVITTESYPLLHLTQHYYEQRDSIERPLSEIHESLKELKEIPIVEKWRVPEKCKHDLEVNKSPKVIVFVWLLESLSQWSVNRASVLEVIANQLTLRSRELSPTLCVRALVAWSSFFRDDQILIMSLLDQLLMGWKNCIDYFEKNKKKNDSSAQISQQPTIFQILNLEKCDGQVKLPLSWHQSNLLIASLRRVGLVPSKYLPLSLLQFARMRIKKLENLETLNRSQQNIEPLSSNVDVQELNDVEATAAEKFKKLAKEDKRQPSMRNGQRKQTKQRLKLAGDVPCRRIPDKKKLDQEMSEWDFKITRNSEKYIPKSQAKRQKQLDDIFGLENNKSFKD